MKKGWQTKTLGELLAVLRNGVNCKQDRSGSGDKVSRIESISDATFDIERVGYAQLKEQDKERFRLQHGDILFSHINSAINVGKTAVFDSDEEVYHGVNLLLMRPSSEVTSSYIEHSLKFLFQTGYWRGVCKQSVNQASVNQQDISRVRVSFPTSLEEQQRIVGLLDEAFASLATAQAHAAQNLQNARELFESHLNAVFTQRGEGWVEKTLSDICEISSSLVDPREKQFLDLPHVGGANIESKTGALIDIKTAREEGLISGKFAFEDTTVLYSKIRPYLMKVARPGFHGLCSADIYPMSPKAGQVDRDYLFHLMLSKHFTDYANIRSARAGMPKVNREHLFQYRTFLPSIAKQKELVTQLDALSAETQRLTRIYEQMLAALAALKKSLLHQAFNGEL